MYRDKGKVAASILSGQYLKKRNFEASTKTKNHAVRN